MEQISQTTSLSSVNQSSSLAASSNQAADAENFSSALSDAMLDEAEFVSGRLGLNLNGDGIPAHIVYFSETGEKLTTSTFSAESILRKTREFGIPLTDLQGLGEQLDSESIGYKPYELYPGTGSDHGIDFGDLIAGGLGTAYDWTKDANVASKGPGARERLAASQALAEELGLHKNSAVTTEKGIDPGYFTPLNTRGGDIMHYVAFNGATASWHATPSAAANTAAMYGGTSYALHDLATAAATIDTSNKTEKISLGKQLENTISNLTGNERTQGFAHVQNFDTSMDFMENIME